MTRRLTLLRHAKSDWSDSHLRDFDRPLNPRGNRDAPMMGKLLISKGISPDLIISSDAERARTTAAKVGAELGYAAERLLISHALYLAGPDKLLDVLLEHAGNFQHVMLVAHNPGMTELANCLSGASIDNLPTCGVFTVESSGADWASLAAGNNKFTGFYSPKQNLS